MGTAATGRHRLRRDRNQLSLRLPVLLLAFGLSGCGSLLNWGGGHASGVLVQEGRVGYYVVNRGDTLYSIAFQVGLDYRQIAAWNAIRWPYRIYPDQRLRLTAPATPVRQAARTRQPTAAPARTQPQPTRTAPAQRAPKPTITPTAGTTTLAWRWPTQGRIVKTFSRSDPGRKGLDIGGRHGQPVRAAAPGRVVYSGSGLRGYGQLIIVKHNSVYLSAYGHNQRLLVKEGETLRAGQLIAEMGDTEAAQPMLHFEIRRNGEPVDPQSLLPKR